MAVDDKWGVGICLHYMGHVKEEMGDYGKARELYQRSFEILRERGDGWQLAGPLLDLAKYAWADGDAAHARALHQESLAIFEEMGNKGGMANTLGFLTAILAAQGDYTQASTAALTMQNLPGGKRDIASGRTRLGQIEYLQGRLAEAKAHFEAGLMIFRELKDENGMGWVPPWLGCVAHRAGDLGRAQTLIEEGLDIVDPDGYWPELAFALLARGDVARAQGDPATAAQYYARSLRIVVEHKDQPDVAERLEGFAKLAGAAQQPQRAARLFGAAEALRERIGTPLPAVERADYDGAVALARAQLDPAAFSAAWAEGKVLGWEEAAAYALET
jgi:tetratricopeptide (TPR) repeat protein